MNSYRCYLHAIGGSSNQSVSGGSLKKRARITGVLGALSVGSSGALSETAIVELAMQQNLTSDGGMVIQENNALAEMRVWVSWVATTASNFVYGQTLFVPHNFIVERATEFWMNYTSATGSLNISIDWTIFYEPLL